MPGDGSSLPIPAAKAEVSQLAGHLARLISDEAWRKKLAAGGVAVLESLFGYEEMLEGYGRLLREARLSRGDPVENPAQTNRSRPTPCAG